MTRKIKVLPFKILFKRSSARGVIEKDIQQWIRLVEPTRSSYSVLENLVWFSDLENTEEFRNLFYYRLGCPSNVWDRLLLALARRLYKPRPSLHIISPSIGPGLLIKHGLGTIINAQKIGENCLIFQEVVIESKEDTGGRPIIGNNVNISVGARILGPVRIGDNVVVGANTVVTKDVPTGHMAIGVPARLVRIFDS
jgi:serine O-acetyltransferase